MEDSVERKNVMLLYADMDRGALGVRSRIAEQLAGESVLFRTIKRLEKAADFLR